MIGRRGGLLGVAARTAVVAGTATAVSGNVARRQQKRADEEAAAQQPAVQAPIENDTTTELENLAALKAKGVLTEDEFTAKKKQILGL